MKVISGYICRGCAIENGADWPEGHAATTHVAECSICKERKPLAHTSDWNWPNQKELEINREV